MRPEHKFTQMHRDALSFMNVIHFSDTGAHMHFQIVTSSYSVVALTRAVIPTPSSSTVKEQKGSYDGSCFASRR